MAEVATKLPIKTEAAPAQGFGPATIRSPAQSSRSAVDADKIKVSFKNGVLTVTLPKSPEAKKTTAACVK